MLVSVRRLCSGCLPSMQHIRRPPIDQAFHPKGMMQVLHLFEKYLSLAYAVFEDLPDDDTESS